MHSRTDAIVERFLIQKLQFKHHEVGSILERMRTLARVGGFDLDHHFATAGLAAGPEARVAAGIVQYAMGGGGSAVSPYEMKNVASKWVRTLRPKGRR